MDSFFIQELFPFHFLLMLIVLHISISIYLHQTVQLLNEAIQIHHLKPLSSIIIFCMALRLFVLIDKKKNAIDLLLQR